MRSWFSTKLAARSSSGGGGGSSDSLAPSSTAAGGFGSVEDFSAPRKDPRIVSPEKEDAGNSSSGTGNARISASMSLERHFQESFRVGGDGEADLLDGNSSVQTEDFLAAFKSDDDQSQASSALLFDEAKYAADDDDDDDDDSHSLVSSNSSEWKAMHASVFLQDLMGSDSNQMDLAATLMNDNHQKGSDSGDDEDLGDENSDGNHNSAGSSEEHAISLEGHVVSTDDSADSQSAPSGMPSAAASAMEDKGGLDNSRSLEACRTPLHATPSPADIVDDSMGTNDNDSDGQEVGSQSHNESGDVSRRSDSNDHSQHANSHGEAVYDDDDDDDRSAGYDSRYSHDHEEGNSDHSSGASMESGGSRSADAAVGFRQEESSHTASDDQSDANSRGSASEGSFRHGDDGSHRSRGSKGSAGSRRRSSGSEGDISEGRSGSVSDNTRPSLDADDSFRRSHDTSHHSFSDHGSRHELTDNDEDNGDGEGSHSRSHRSHHHEGDEDDGSARDEHSLHSNNHSSSHSLRGDHDEPVSRRSYLQEGLDGDCSEHSRDSSERSREDGSARDPGDDQSQHCSDDDGDASRSSVSGCHDVSHGSDRSALSYESNQDQDSRGCFDGSQLAPDPESNEENQNDPANDSSIPVLSTSATDEQFQAFSAAAAIVATSEVVDAVPAVSDRSTGSRRSDHDDDYDAEGANDFHDSRLSMESEGDVDFRGKNRGEESVSSMGDASITLEDLASPMPSSPTRSASPQSTATRPRQHPAPVAGPPPANDELPKVSESTRSSRSRAQSERSDAEDVSQSTDESQVEDAATESFGDASQPSGRRTDRGCEGPCSSSKRSDDGGLEHSDYDDSRISEYDSRSEGSDESDVDGTHDSYESDSRYREAEITNSGGYGNFKRPGGNQYSDYENSIHVQGSTHLSSRDSFDDRSFENSRDMLSLESNSVHSARHASPSERMDLPIKDR
jgi:hypothetical protein